ncbi:hypothetical protein TKK_0012645 [Trichogramma kaykai]
MMTMMVEGKPLQSYISSEEQSLQETKTPAAGSSSKPPLGGYVVAKRALGSPWHSSCTISASAFSSQLPGVPQVSWCFYCSHTVERLQ